jgi:hypothetical protein
MRNSRSGYAFWISCLALAFSNSNSSCFIFCWCSISRIRISCWTFSSRSRYLNQAVIPTTAMIISHKPL